MPRLDNWQSNLSNVINARRAQPFIWGKTDCTQFAFEAIKAVTGNDMAAPYFGKYKTAKGALKILQTVDGVKTPTALFVKHLGEAKSIAFARKGDVVTCDPKSIGYDAPDDAGALGDVVGVCYGQMSYFVGASGLVAIQTLQCSECFHVESVVQ